MDKLRKVLSGQDNRDNDSSTGILPVSFLFISCGQLYYECIYSNLPWYCYMFLKVVLNRSMPNIENLRFTH